jgi:hypothetical protein
VAKRYLGPAASDAHLGARIDPTAEIVDAITGGALQATMDAQGTPAFTAVGLGALNQYFVGKHSESGPAASAAGRSVARLGANLRGATGVTNSGNPNGYVDFQATATATDSATPMDFRVALPGTGVTPAERLRVLSLGGIQIPEHTLPAGVADNATVSVRDNGSGVTQAGWVMPDSTFRVTASSSWADFDTMQPETILGPTGALAETVDRAGGTITNVATLTTQKLFLVGIALKAGMTVTNISFHTGATAAGTPTNWWFALYSYHATAPVLLRQTADQTTTAMAANTPFTKALTSPYVITASGMYYLGIMVKATTVPTLLVSSPNALVASMAPILQGNTADTGLTTTAPNPAGAITSANTRAYAWVT